MDNSAVFHRDALDGDHRRTFPKDKPWIFDCDEYQVLCATEEEACAEQRKYRESHGFHPITGERIQ